MGFFSDFFGGGESTTTTQVKTKPTYSKEQEELLKSMAGIFKGGLSGPTSPAPSMFVPKTREETAYLDWVSELANQRAMGQLLSGEPAYELGQDWAGDWFDEYMRPTYEQEFQRYTIPGLRAAYAGPGYHGSPRARAETTAASDLATTIAKARGELLYSEELAERQAIDAALGRASEAIPSYTNILGTAGAYSRGIEQERVMDTLNRYLMGEEVGGSYEAAYNPYVQLSMQLLGFSPYTYLTGSTTESKGPGLGYGILTGLSQGWASTWGE